jgi:hypothetical protein
MKLTDVTSLGRTIDPSYGTNRAIAILSIAVVAISASVQLLAGEGWLKSITWGLGAGFSVFLAWALARELDPEHDLSAFVAAVLMLVGLGVYGLPELLPMLWMLLTLRIVNRVVGPPATLLDSLGELGLGAWLTWPGQWVYGLITTLAFLLDGVLSAPLRHRHSNATPSRGALAFAAFSLISTVVIVVVSATGNGWRVLAPSPARTSVSALPAIGVVILSSVLFLIVILNSRHTRAVSDTTQQPLDPRRVQAGQALALATGLLLTWSKGTTGLVALLPLWSAMAGTGLYRISVLLFKIRPTDSARTGE